MTIKQSFFNCNFWHSTYRPYYPYGTGQLHQPLGHGSQCRLWYSIGRRTFSIYLLLISLAFFGTTSRAEEVAKDETYFSVSGDFSVSVDQATAQMVRIRDRTPALTITSAPASIKKLGGSHSVNLFFSNDFAPNTGTYPIAFSYRKHANTLGGSFIKPGGMFSHDTEGTAEFIEFGEQVRVRFEFTTYDKSEGTEGRQGVTVKGEAVCPWADIF